MRKEPRLPGLAKLQKLLLDSIEGKEQAWRKLLPWIRADGKAGANERLRIYREGYWRRLSTNLEWQYSWIRRALGELVFRRLTREYIGLHKPRAHVLFEEGADFSEFLAKHPISRTHPFLEDMARLERAINETALVRLPETAARSPKRWGVRSRFRLASSARTMLTRWPTHVFWHSKESEAKLLNLLPLGPGEYLIALSRKDYRVIVTACEGVEASVLRSLVRGRRLSDIRNALSSADRRRMASWVRRWVSRDILVPV